MRPRHRGRLPAVLVAASAVLAASCSADTTATSDPTASPGSTAATVEAGVARSFPPPPPVPQGPLSAQNERAVDALVAALDGDLLAVTDLFESDPDPRTLWILADVLRFVQGTAVGAALTETAEVVAGVELQPSRPWGDLTDHLIAWDIPAPTRYLRDKRAVFTAADERWRFVFDDPDSTIDHRLVHWGGVPIDDRPPGDPGPCPRGCIPALDDPALTTAAEGRWYPDDGVVFGVEVDGEAVAFPRNIMEVHEMVNLTIGGRRIALPYCTLCGSAQAFLTDEVVDVDRPLTLRTSGLLNRSNKISYDLETRSVFDTFTGAAVAGPLRAAGTVLAQVPVVTTTWAEWRRAHPDTTIVAEDGGIGRNYPLDPLGGRDDDGPIFPIGPVDDRLRVHEQVLGVVVDDGRAIAFPAAAAEGVLRSGGRVELDGVSVVSEAGGLRARDDDGPLPSHQAFWFAWSQFHPDTELWLP